MNDLKMNYFGNDNYKVLKIMNDNQVEILGETIIPLTQQDVADLAKFSRVKTNQIINDLIDNGFLGVYQGKRGKYLMTKLGKEMVKKMEENVKWLLLIEKN